jgi:hypothetical protein
MENSSEYYYEKLKVSDKPGNILAAMFCSLYNIEITKSEIILFNRLLKVFSRSMIFFAVLDAVGSYTEKIENPYPLLYTICKRRFEAAHGDSFIQAREDLKPFIASLDKSIEKQKKAKIKIPSSKGLE